MHETVVTEVETLVAKGLHAFGGTIPNDGCISWIPATSPGYVPLNCYLLQDGSSGLMVDTSLPIIEEAVVGQASRVQLDHVTLVLTRVVEFDSIGNAELVEQVLPINEVYAHFLPAQWMYFRAGRHDVPRRRFDWHLLEDGATIAVGPSRNVICINARLKLLATAWLYDEATRTLFTSDSFSHALTPDPTRRVLTEAQDDVVQSQVTEHLRTKFDWLEGADTYPLRRFLDHVFETYDVETVAPTYGCILSGKTVVERHRQMIDRALKDLGRLTVTSAGGVS